MKFSYSATWHDAMRMLRENGSLLLALAGAFFLLPALLTAYFLPQPEAAGDAALPALVQYVESNWHWLLLANIVNMLGTVAIYLLLLGRRGTSVGGAITGALPILPFYFLLSILMGLIVGLGLFLLILPGIYLLGRIAIAGAVMVAEERRSPIDAIRQAFGKTKGHGWAVAGLVLIVGIAAILLSFAVTAVLGSLFLLVGGREGLGALLVLILDSALSAALSVLLIALFAAIYRSLSSMAAPTSGI